MNLQGAIDEVLGLFGAGRFADMERHARTALSAFPDSAILSELVGIAMTAQYRHREALAFLERAVALDASDAQFWENLGLCQLQLRQLAAAETSLRRGLAIDPHAVPALAALASVLTALGRGQEAEAVTEQASRDRPRLRAQGARVARAPASQRDRGQSGIGPVA